MSLMHQQRTILWSGPDEITVRLFVRWYALRKLSVATEVELVPRLLQEGPYVWTFSNPSDPWGSKSQISMEQLTAMVERAEAAIAAPRKPAGRAMGAVEGVKVA